MVPKERYLKILWNLEIPRPKYFLASLDMFTLSSIPTLSPLSYCKVWYTARWKGGPWMRVLAWFVLLLMFMA